MASFIKVFGLVVDRVETPRQLALGIALGSLIGVLPKDNILFVGSVILLIVSGANLLTGAVACFIGCLSTNLIEPVAHRLGQHLLAPDCLYAPVQSLMQLPLAPWTRLDNTVVAGCLFLGVVAFIPMYLISLLLFHRYREQLQRAILENSLMRWTASEEQS